LTALIIIGVILLIIILLLLLRVGIRLEFEKKFTFSVLIGSINIFSNEEKPKKVKASKAKKKKDSKPETKKENFVKKVYKEKGLTFMVKLFSEIAKAVINKLLWLIKRMKIRNFFIDISIVGNDAADTAIKYGAVCAAVYPLLALIDSNLDFKARQINVKSDFEGNESSFCISADIKAEIIILLAVAIKAYCEYKKIRDVYFNERNRH